MLLPINVVHLATFSEGHPEIDLHEFIKQLKQDINVVAKLTAEKIRLNKIEIKETFDKNISEWSWSVGPSCWLYDPVAHLDEHNGPFTITHLTSHGCRLQNPVNQKIVPKMVHLNPIKPHYQQDDTPDNDLSDLTLLKIIPDLEPSVTASVGQSFPGDLPVGVANQVQLDTPLIDDSGTDPQVQTDQGPVLVPDGTTDVVLRTPVTDSTILLNTSPSVVCPDSSLHDTNDSTDVMYAAKCLLKQKVQGSTKQFRVLWEDPDSVPSWVPASNVNEALTRAFYKTQTKTGTIV